VKRLPHFCSNLGNNLLYSPTTEGDDEALGDLESLYFDDDEKGFLAILYRSYLDESSDGKAEEIFMAAGFFGIPAVWTDLRRKWKLQLATSAKAHGLSKLDYFSSKGCRNLQEEFFPLRDHGSLLEMKKVALRIRDELQQVVLAPGSDIEGIGIGVNMKDFREYNSRAEVRANPNWNPNHEDAAFQLIFGRIAEIVRNVEISSRCPLQVGFVCDDGPNGNKIEASYDRLKAKHTGLAHHMRGISHLDDKKQPPLQMADLMADVGREMATQWLYDKEVVCRLRGRVLEIKMYDRDVMDKVLNGENIFALG
jgi:hypothetical protein